MVVCDFWYSGEELYFKNNSFKKVYALNSLRQIFLSDDNWYCMNDHGRYYI